MPWTEPAVRERRSSHICVAELDMKKIRLRQDVVLRTVAGETMLIAVRDAVRECVPLRVVNKTAAIYLKELEKPCTEEDLVLAAAKIFDADPEVLRSDIRAFVRELRSEKYLEEVTC
jgi:hypothetical protein